jgi:hypothetical protein
MKQPVGIIIPDELKFSDLKMTRDPVTLDVEFEWEPIEAICAASGIDAAIFRDQHEDNVAELINAWYAMHREAGGDPDLVQEQLLAEAQAESVAGIAGVQSGPAMLQ